MICVTSTPETEMNEVPPLPIQPGYYVLDQHLGWIKVPDVLNMLSIHGEHEGSMCRIVIDPITDGII